jgi:hypothetical protein
MIAWSESTKDRQQRMKNRFEAFGLIDTAFLVGDLCASIPAFRLHPPTALADWKHILLAKLTLLGIQKIRKWYDRLHSRSLKDV